jgi:hypothetical protein
VIHHFYKNVGNLLTFCCYAIKIIHESITEINNMKIKLMAILTFATLLFTGCYDDSNKATVRINLGNVPIAKQVEKKSIIDKVLSIFVKDAYAQVPAGVIKVHLAAYRGDSLIAKESINAGGITSNVVEFIVPAGDNITILVVGESSYEGQDSKPVYYAEYYGYNSADLKAGSTTEISITMTIARWNGTIDVNGVPRELFVNPVCGPPPFTISWTSAGIKVKYIVVDYSGSLPVIKYSGYDTGYSGESTETVELYVEFEDFNLRTLADAPQSGC